MLHWLKKKATITALMASRLQPGDVVVSSTNKWVSFLIQWLTNGTVSHVAMVMSPTATMFEAMDDGDAFKRVIRGSLTGALQVVPTLTQDYSSQRHVSVLRLCNTDSVAPGQRTCAAALANSTGSQFYAPLLALAGTAYTNRWRNPLLALVAQGLLVVQEALRTPSAYCSHLVAAAYRGAGVNLFAFRSEFVLPKDFLECAAFEQVLDVFRHDLPRSWLPTTPAPVLAGYHRLLRSIVTDPDSLPILEAYNRTYGPSNASNREIRHLAREPALALLPIIRHPNSEFAKSLDPIILRHMILTEYKESVLQACRYSVVAAEADDEWKAEVQVTDHNRLKLELETAESTKTMIEDAMRQWINSQSLKYWLDVYVDAIADCESLLAESAYHDFN